MKVNWDSEAGKRLQETCKTLFGTPNVDSYNKGKHLFLLAWQIDHPIELAQKCDKEQWEQCLELNVNFESTIKSEAEESYMFAKDPQDIEEARLFLKQFNEYWQSRRKQLGFDAIE